MEPTRARGSMLLFALVTLLSAISADATGTIINSQDKVFIDALVAQWKTDAGGTWTGIDCSAMKGMTCDSDGHITNIELYSSDTGKAVNAPLPSEISGVSKLSYLYTSGLNMTGSLPVTMSALASLTYVNLEYDSLTSIDAIYGVSALQELGVSYDSTRAPIKKKISKLSALTNLYLEYSNVTKLPPNIFKLTNLYTLDVSYMPALKNLPKSISKMSSLRYLYLGYNPAMPAKHKDLARFTALKSLIHIYDSGNGLTSIPTSITAITGLSQLGLYGNNITSIPTEISKMTTLQYMSLAGNPLGSVPAELGCLTNLNYLNLGTTFKCPAVNSPCVVQQKVTSKFCVKCASFCSTCTAAGAAICPGSA